MDYRRPNFATLNTDRLYMCGIFFIASLKDHSLDRQILENNLSSIFQRGPDKLKITYNSTRTVYLYNSILNITSPSSDINIPYHEILPSEDAKSWFAFNGEIYDWQSSGENFANDTELFYDKIKDSVDLRRYTMMIVGDFLLICWRL